MEKEESVNKAKSLPNVQEYSEWQWTLEKEVSRPGDAVHHWNIVAPQPTSCFSYCWIVLVYQVHSQLFVVKYTTSCTAAKCPSIWWATSLSISASDVVPYLKAILPITPQNWTHPWHSYLQSNIPNYVSHIVTNAFDNFSKKGSPNNRELRLTFPRVMSKTAYGMLGFIFLYFNIKLFK